MREREKARDSETGMDGWRQGRRGEGGRAGENIYISNTPETRDCCQVTQNLIPAKKATRGRILTFPEVARLGHNFPRHNAAGWLPNSLLLHVINPINFSIGIRLRYPSSARGVLDW